MNSSSSNASNTATSGPPVSGPAVPTDIQLDLDDLTQQIISIRKDLENEGDSAS
jgi:hypothetical protein